jgi:two-component system, cell cycle sensor histidine kinase and response regulator CckA
VLERIVGSRIVLHFELGSEAANDRIDEGGFEQVVLNLAINARDAMPNGGTLSILVEDVELERSRATPLGIPGGQYVRIAVSDDGLGMDEETCARCFEPFLTTKGPRGTGLGLPAVRGVIHAGGGAISVTSQPGRGSTFEVLLPAVKERRGAERGALPAPPPGSPETILVADDDAELRRLMSRVLVRSGYRVLEAATGAAALDLAAQAEAGIDLVVTDVVMPGMSGPELVGLLRGNSPLLSVLFVSGSAKEADLTGATPGRVAYLRKPFLPSELVLRVRSALEERAHSGV